MLYIQLEFFMIQIKINIDVRKYDREVIKIEVQVYIQNKKTTNKH